MPISSLLRGSDVIDGELACESDKQLPCVLIVDDDSAIRRLLGNILTSEQPFDILEAEDGQVAKDLLRQHRVDVVITDLNMPKGVSGLDLIEWAKENHPDPVWIILSGYASFETAVRAIHLGAFDFIPKPLESPASLQITVRNALEKRSWLVEREHLNRELEETNAQLRHQVEKLETACQLLGDQAENIADDLGRAGRIQHALLPQIPPKVPGISVSALYRPSHGVGGDLYDVFALDDKRVAFAIADAAGHGISAAMLAVLVKMHLRRISTSPGTPAQPHQIMQQLNELLVDECESSGLFVTAAYGFIDTESGKVTFASAGHPPLILRHANGKAEMLYHTGPALGLSRGATYAQSSVVFQENDQLLCYTDGLYDDWPVDNEPSNEIVLEMLDELAKPLPETVNALLHDACLRRDGLSSKDDVTLLLIAARDGECVLDNHAPSQATKIPNELPSLNATILMGSDEQGTALCVQGRGDWTHCTALHDQAEREINHGNPLTIDLSCCTYLDSTFLGTLHEIVSHADARNTKVSIQGLIPHLHSYFGELGMDQVLSHVHEITHPLPMHMSPLCSNAETSQSNRNRLLKAHQALSTISDENREQFLRLISTLETDSVH
jgi:sigma-B regulation protein RsbU (phosphoserine phosphatase)